MYSIYDQYGSTGDLQNRYDAAKSAGNPSGNVYGNRITQPLNNSPFLNANKGGTASLDIPWNQQRMSLYDMAEGYDSNSSASPYSDADLANYPSPAFFNTLANNFPTAIATGAGIVSGGPLGAGLGYGVGEAIKSATDPNRTWGDRGWDALRGLLGIGIGRTGIAGDLTKGIGNLYARMGSTTAINAGLRWGLNSMLDMLTGYVDNRDNPYHGPRGMLEKGLDYISNRFDIDKPTIGDPRDDPFLAVGPYTETPNNDQQNYIDDWGGYPDGSNDGAWGGPSGDWTGDAWGDSWY